VSARLVVVTLLLAVGLSALAACGRVGAPMAPAGVPDIYPKAYPSADKQ
jgi:hypothetical protein